MMWEKERLVKLDVQNSNYQSHDVGDSTISWWNSDDR